MAECSAVREQMPELLVESLAPGLREDAHQHIEECAECGSEWAGFRTTWMAMGDLPERSVPLRVRDEFLQQIEALAPKPVVVPFRQRRIFLPMAQAAAVVILVGGSFLAGQRNSAPGPLPQASARLDLVQQLPFNIAESRVIPASQINPDIQGRPDIQNVRFMEVPEKNNEVGIAFDLKSHVTITGRRDDPSVINLLSYVMQNREHTSQARSSAIQWVKDNYTSTGDADPQIVKALANVLKNDTHEGVRINAVEALKSLPGTLAPEARAALIDALRNDPNPAVRIKAVDALANLAQSGAPMDTATVDTLREKASQNDENLYVRVKAAEALNQINL